MISYQASAPAPAVEAHTALRDSLFDVTVAIGRHHVDDFPGLLEFVQDKVLIVVGRPAKNAHGWIAPESWRNASDYATEIYINADARGVATAAELAYGMWTTIAHELAHAVNFIDGVQGVSRQGRWHNRNFAEVALALGTNVERHLSLGHVTTGPLPGATDRYAEEIAAIEDALVLAWAPRPRTPRTRTGGQQTTSETEAVAGGNGETVSQDGKYISATCECVTGRGQRRAIRVAFGSWSIGPIHCPVCGTDFTAGQLGVSASGVSDTSVSTTDRPAREQ